MNEKLAEMGPVRRTGPNLGTGPDFGTTGQVGTGPSAISGLYVLLSKSQAGLGRNFSQPDFYSALYILTKISMILI